MRHFQASVVWRRRIFSWPMLLLLILVCVVSARSLVGLVGKSRRAAAAAREAELRLATLTAREEALRAQLAALKTREGEEAYIRETYPVVREGEGVIQLIAEEEQATSSVVITPEPSWWQFWK